MTITFVQNLTRLSEEESNRINTPENTKAQTGLKHRGGEEEGKEKLSVQQTPRKGPSANCEV
jgi:hypothetical protein